jgi:hypothetical protein
VPCDLGRDVPDARDVEIAVGSLRVRMVTNPGADREQIQRTFERRIPMASLQFEFVSDV